MPIKKIMVSIRLPEEVHKELTELSETMGLSKNAFIIGLIHKALNEKAQNGTKECEQ